MTFSQDLNGFKIKVGKMERDVFVGSTEEVHRSIVFGSEITGAPGQPVDTGALRDSWTPAFVDESTWQDTTNLVYAPIIEDNERGATLRSSVGGFHSVKMTRVAWPRIVEYVTRKVRGRNGGV